MTDSKKISEHSNPHSAFLRISSNMRGIVKGIDLIQYTLGLLLYRLISEKQCSIVIRNEKKPNKKKCNYAALSNTEAEKFREIFIEETGFFILPSELFNNILKRVPKEADLGKTLAAVFKNIETSSQGTNNEFKVGGLFDDLVFNDKKFGETVAERNSKLADLLNAIADLPNEKNDEIFNKSYGAAFDFLLDRYAAIPGNRGGLHFTPQAISELLVRITLAGRQKINKVYDPACGSGSLLLKFANVLGKENVLNGFFGQDINSALSTICRKNMLLHDIKPEQFDIAQGDTLTDPYHRNIAPFDAIVSNPPFSANWEGNSNPKLIKDNRFSPAGVLAPRPLADMAFVMHAVSWLDSNGTAAIVSYPAVMHRTGAEQKIRKYLVDKNYVDAVIQLPADLFFGSSFAFCILVLKKNKLGNKVLFIDASKQFKRGTDKNILNHNHMKRILQCYENRESHHQFSKLVDNEEIAKNEYNFTIREYVELEDAREKINIHDLNTGIEASALRQNEIRKQIKVKVSNMEETHMRKIDSLISQFCKDGVEYMKLKDIFVMNKGFKINYSGKKQKKHIPWFRGSDIPKSGVILSESSKQISEEQAEGRELFPANSIIYSMSTVGIKHALITIPHLASENILSLSLKSDFSKHIDMRFMNYFCFILDNWWTANKITTNEIFPSANMNELPYFKFAIPPLQVQKEIVDILDGFTKPLSELESELERELEALSKKHDYYLNSLLSFQQKNVYMESRRELS